MLPVKEKPARGCPGEPAPERERDQGLVFESAGCLKSLHFCKKQLVPLWAWTFLLSAASQSTRISITLLFGLCPGWHL